MDEYEAERVYGPSPLSDQQNRASADGHIEFAELPTLREALVGLSLVTICLLVPTLLISKRIRRNR